MTHRKVYLLNPNTLALLPEKDSSGRLYSRVYEGHESFLVKKSPKDIMKESLIYYGSYLKGATIAAKDILGVSRMVPIAVCMSLDMYWFPTHSPDNDECMWFSLVHIDEIKPSGYFYTTLFFLNGLVLRLPFKKKRLEGKIYNAGKLKHIMDERTKNKKMLLYLDNFNKAMEYPCKYIARKRNHRE